MPWIVTCTTTRRSRRPTTAATPTCCAAASTSSRSGTSTTSISRSAGHDHNYERSKPLTGPADNPTIHAEPKDGTVYVVCAGAGADGYSPGTSAFTEMSHGYDDSAALGVYGMLTATQTTLKLEAHELRTDATDPIFDTLTITK